MSINEVENSRLHDVDWKKIGITYTSNSKRSKTKTIVRNIPPITYESNAHNTSKLINRMIRRMYE